MNWFDVVALVVIGLSAGFAFFKGFVREVISLAGLVIAAILAFRFYPEGASLLESYIDAENLRNLTSFLSIFFGIVLIAALISFSIKRLLDTAGLAFYDRFLGLLFGLLRGVFIVYIFVLVLSGFGIARKTMAESRSYHVVSRTMEVILSFFPGGDGDQDKESQTVPERGEA